MLHVTTEVGKVGMKERERRHFPSIHNRPGPFPPFKPQGRRYIPHGYGIYDEWRPHPENIQPEYTETGPDWKSRLKYIPDPQDPKYPAAEIFENNWKAMRPFPYIPPWYPDTYMNTKKEWLLDPGLSNAGMRCTFNGEHMATRTSSDEITHTLLYGRGRNENYIDKRNGIGEASPGDKNYCSPEYSPKFHKLGSSLPIIEFGANSPWKKTPDTFVPLQPLPDPPSMPSNIIISNNRHLLLANSLDPDEKPRYATYRLDPNCLQREPYKIRARRQEKELEKKTVRALDEWRPATPLKAEKIEEKK